MGKSVNRWVGLGNIGKDPEIKSTSGGTLVANFSIATTDRRKDSAGNWQDQTEWTSLVAYGRTAEIVRDYVKKGSKLYVEGKLQTRSWEKDGQKRSTLKVVCDRVQFLGGGRNADSAEGAAMPQPSPRREAAPAPDEPLPEASGPTADEDNLPF